MNGVRRQLGWTLMKAPAFWALPEDPGEEAVGPVHPEKQVTRWKVSLIGLVWSPREMRHDPEVMAFLTIASATVMVTANGLQAGVISVLQMTKLRRGRIIHGRMETMQPTPVSSHFFCPCYALNRCGEAHDNGREMSDSECLSPFRLL